MNIRKMELYEVKDIYPHIVNDFALGEYPPMDVIYKKMHEGIWDGMVFCEKNDDIAYALCSLSNSGEFGFISLISVFPRFRCKGMGTEFVRQIIMRYSRCKGIVVEVEKLEDAADPEERTSRTRRMRFYDRLGFIVIPGIEYESWGTPFNLMVLPISISFDEMAERIKDIMHDVYLPLSGEMFMDKIVFK